MPEGRKRPVVEGYLTNEVKRHEVILSYSSEFYSDDREMILGAKVYAYNGEDTIYYYEQLDKPGHYLTDSVAGHKNKMYYLQVFVEENTLYNAPIHMSAEAYMPNNARGIDSVGLLPLLNGNGIPFVDERAAVCVCHNIICLEVAQSDASASDLDVHIFKSEFRLHLKTSAVQFGGKILVFFFRKIQFGGLGNAKAEPLRDTGFSDTLNL